VFVACCAPFSSILKSLSGSHEPLSCQVGSTEP
jgi:hypothetical protein